MFVFMMAIGMHWKKRRLSIPRQNHNVITLNQTLLLVTLIYIDNTFLPYFLDTGGWLLFNLEMIRIIFIENIAFKVVFPLLLIWSTKSRLPALWADRNERRLDFFMTNPSYEARPALVEFQRERRRSSANRFITLSVHISNETQNLTPVQS